ncbi:methyltransferase [Thalassotalea sp. PLHSN55]|uniref:methyltransferase n=1 Tax=Thalassotalea sp. PLHSN55 TaxID=3435888 RepID=UPI003F8292E8
MHNLSQVLLRNSNLLAASSTLIINLPADEFMHDYLNLYPQCQLNYFTTNFEYFQLIEKSKPKSVNSFFAAQYRSDKKHDLAIIAFPKSKAELAFTLAMLNESLTDDARVLIIGENKSGIKSVEKLSKDYLQFCSKADSARHCSLYSGQYIKQNKTFDIEQWYKIYQFTIDGVALKVASLPGVFSQNNLDVGTRVLLENLPTDYAGKVLDFGCGAGVIASFVSKKYPTTEFTLVDVSALALHSAQKTLALNGVTTATYLPSNSLSEVSEKYQHILSNPPFHQGVKTNYLATETFLQNIKRHLYAKGSVTIVANSFLKYPPIMAREIAPVSTVVQKNGFSVYRCTLK